MSTAIETRFIANLDRVRGLISLYVQVAGSVKGRPSVTESDLLRAAVVQLQASLEDLLRDVAAERLPASGEKILRQIPLPVGIRRKATFTLGDLSSYRNLSVEDVLARSIGVFLERSTFGNLNKATRLLKSIGLRIPSDNSLKARVAAMMARRHHIGHRLDRNESIGRGQHQARSISKRTVERWLDAVELFGRDILSQM